MAQQQPNNPNTGGTGNASQSYSEVRAPQFVGGSLDTTTGNIDSSTPQQAAGAPPPQTPTTRLGQLGPTPTQAIARSAAPYIGASIGSSLGSGASLTTALKSPITNITDSFGAGPGTGVAAGTDTAFLNGTSGVPYVTGGTASATPGLGGAAASTGGSLGSAAGAGAGAGIATFGIDLATGMPLKQSAAEGIGAGAGAFLGSLTGIPGASIVGAYLGEYAAPEISKGIDAASSGAHTAVRDIGSFFSHAFSF